VSDPLTWVVVGPYCYGSGESYSAALAKAKSEAPAFVRQPMDHNVYRASPDWTVDHMGSIEATELEKVREVRHP
jgi:hypothetical protein